MKYRISSIVIACALICNSFTFQNPTVTLTDFKNLIGCWTGTITYLDYTSNKPFSMPLEITVKDFNKSNLITCSLVYPDEPKANTLDTISISENGRAFNNEPVKTKRLYNSDSLVLVTEIRGIDGNDNKQAVIRHTYILGKNSYVLRKEVQFVGQTLWILRNEYKLIRKDTCP